MTTAGKLALVIAPDGTTRELGHKPTLEEAQAIVGGYVEAHSGWWEGRRCQVLMDEDARFKNPQPPLNEMATLICKAGVIGTVIILQGWRF